MEQSSTSKSSIGIEPGALVELLLSLSETAGPAEIIKYVELQNQADKSKIGLITESEHYLMRV